MCAPGWKARQRARRNSQPVVEAFVKRLVGDAGITSYVIALAGDSGPFLLISSVDLRWASRVTVG